MPKSSRNIVLPSPAGSLPETDRAQRFIDSARDSVRNAIDAMDQVRELRRQREHKSKAGQLADSDMDQLRMAIVFAGAGIDSTLKQLIRDALPSVTRINENAAKKFRDFVDRTLAPGGESTAGHRTLVNILLSDAQSPREALLELYIGELCGGSLQSAEELNSVAEALGISDNMIRRRISDAVGPRRGTPSKLRQLFDARNQIVHELDLQVPEKTGDRSRRARAIPDTVAWVTEGLTVAQLVLNDVTNQLKSAPA